MRQAERGREGEERVRWHGETFVLVPERAVWWPARDLLLVADPHFGKGAAFRRAGVPVPAGSTRENLERLQRAVTRTGAAELLFLGDFFHQRGSRSVEVMDALHQWREAHGDLAITLIRGNHDKSAGDPPATLGIQCRRGPCERGGFVLRHEPARAPRRPCFAGHLHPAVRLRGPGRERLTAPCYWFGEFQAVLPSFGAFTGSSNIRPGAGDQVFVVDASGVLRLTGPPSP